MTFQRRLLWVDDDGQDRFPFEIDCLIQAGWQITWAVSAQEAIEALLAESFDLVLLDQVFPFEVDGRHTDVWSGCRLLYWIRGNGIPSKAPHHHEWVRLAEYESPQNGNGNVEVIVISAFQDDDVDEALRSIHVPPKILPKPVDDSLLLELVGEVAHRGL